MGNIFGKCAFGWEKKAPSLVNTNTFRQLIRRDTDDGCEHLPHYRYFGLQARMEASWNLRLCPR